MKAWLQDDPVAHRMIRDDNSLVVEKPMVMLQLFRTGVMGSSCGSVLPAAAILCRLLRELQVK